MIQFPQENRKEKEPFSQTIKTKDKKKIRRGGTDSIEPDVQREQQRPGGIGDKRKEMKKRRL